MTQFTKKFLSLLAAGLFIVVSTGCQRENPGGGQEEAAGASAPAQSGQGQTGQ